MHITANQLLQVYAVAQSIPQGTPIFLDSDGDVAFAKEPEFPDGLPEDCIYLCTADHDTHAMPHFRIYQSAEGMWRVAGYGNEFEERGGAVQFALNTCGVDGEVFDDFTEHVANSIQQAFMVA